MNRLISASLAAILLAGSPAAAQYAIRGGPIYGGPFAGGGPSYFTGPYSPPYYPYPITGAGFGPSYLGAAPYAGGYVSPQVAVPYPMYYTTPQVVYPKPQVRANQATTQPPPTTPGGPAEGSRSSPDNPPTGSDAPVGRAHFTVTVPADAKVWVNDIETKSTGASRRFHTPATLEGGKVYEYTFKAQWTENAQPVTRDQTIRFRAGEDHAVDFTKVTAR